MAYEIGSRVGEYEVLAVLGAGGMGQVYKVRNVISNRVEAMKVLLPNLENNPDLADRFMREIKVQASLDHPNIAKLYTALRVENQLLMLMEFIEGTTLAGLLKSGAVPVNQAVEYVSQVLLALSYAHSSGVVHRDVKPTNIIITTQGVAKLMDFGIAKATADQRLTKTGLTVGSLFYMSPEQIRGAIDLDPRSDLYSLGVVMYEMFTGAPPFKGDSDYAVMSAHLEKMPAPLFELDPAVPPLLSEITLKALEKDPARRFQSADALRRALSSVPLTQPEPAPPPARTATMQPPAAALAAVQQKSHRGLYIALGSVLTILVLILAATQIPKYRKTSADTPAPAAEAAPPIAAEMPAQPAPVAPVEQPAPPPPSEPAPAPEPAKPREAAFAVKPVAPKVVVREEPRPETPPAPVQPAAQPSAAPAPAPAPPQAAAESKNAALLEETREQFVLLATRANATRGSIENLRRQQAAMGVGLRADVASGLQRMEFYLDECEAALKKGDAAAAKKNLDSAERETSKLETFLGR